MVHNSRMLSGAVALILVACSTLIACDSTVPLEPTNVVRSSLMCGDNWLETGTLVEARYIATATRLTCPSTAPDCAWEGMVLVAGGYGAWGALGSAERYDPVSETWSGAGTLRFPRYFHRAIGLQDGKVLVVGGVTDSGSSTETAEIYDPATNTWSDAASMSIDRYAHQLTLLSDGRVLASGGQGGGLPAMATAEIYDPQRNQWQPAGSMASPRSAAGAALLPDGRVLVAGGYNGMDYLSSAEIYSPATNTWSSAASMSVTHYTPGAVTLPDGRVLVVGGTDSLPGAEIFDPASGTWSPTPDMVYVPRYFFETIPLADGRVMVVGGVGSVGMLDGVEIFDTGLGLWMPVNSMTMSRYLAAAVELLDGQILVAGGFARNIYGAEDITNAAEKYLPCPPNLPPAAFCADRIAYTGPNATTCTAAAVSVNNGSYDPDNGPAPMTLWQMPAVGEPLVMGDTSAILVASDGILQGYCTATITAVDNTPPQLMCPTIPEIIECQWDGNSASQGEGVATFEDFVGVADNCSEATATCTLSGQRLPLGDHTVTCSSTDWAQNTASCNFVARVADTQPPVPGGSTNMVLSPVDSGLVEISLMECAEHTFDACQGRLNLHTNGVITYITSDEPENAPGNGDGNTSNDMQIKKPWLALLRAERNSAGNGRVYTVHYRVTDDLTDPNARYADSSCKVYVPVQAGTPPDQVGDDTGSGYCVGSGC
jgi:N-acetylneuraminic acid mutarotase